MTKIEFQHKMKNVASLMQWLEERGSNNRAKNKVEYLCYKMIKETYDLLDYAQKFIPENKEDKK